MNPIYRFELSKNGANTQAAKPNYSNDLAIEYELEQNEEFYRGKLSGKLTFQKDDFTYIKTAAFDTQFDVEIFISYDGGQTWTSYWKGKFFKTDCEFNDDDKTAIVTPTLSDRYNDVLSGLEKEFNLIDLAPEIQPIKLDKRPMFQVYVPGQTTIGCMFPGIWWEQECESVSESDTVDIGGQTINKLTEYLHFAQCAKKRSVTVVSGDIPVSSFVGDAPEDDTTPYIYRTGEYDFTFGIDERDGHIYYEYIIYKENVNLWEAQIIDPPTPPETPMSLILLPVPGTGAVGNIEVYISDFRVYSRMVLDKDSFDGSQTYPLPNDDITANRNYHYCHNYDMSAYIYFSGELSETPTKWGVYQPGKYYDVPDNTQEYYPVGRNQWGSVSYWVAPNSSDLMSDEALARNQFELRDCYSISSVISVLLSKIAPGITHNGTIDYSSFLYAANNPISNIAQTLFITPKSNVVTSGYDQPAQKAPITLKRVTDMLRDCFRCYWFIDENNRFCVEHISYFMRGGSYTGTPVVGMDLTALTVTRNGKPWSYARNQYQFDKPEMAARYQFGWMDDVTELFDGFPIDILSKYVNPDNIEQIDVSQFTSDVDYILLNPGDISKDGFVLLAAYYNVGKIEYEFDLDDYSQINRQLGSDGKWLTNSNKHILIPVAPGERLRITAGASYAAQLAWFVSDAAPVAGADAPLVEGTTRFSLTKNTTAYYNVPAGANYLYIFWGQTSNPGAYLPAKVYRVAQPAYYLPYVDFQYNNSDHVLQNAWVAFAYLQQYYMFDMPAWNVAINGVQQIVQGIKKLKTQTIKFPVLAEPNLTNLIKTELGNGVIQKMSVNLSSRNANTTLKYDTE